MLRLRLNLILLLLFTGIALNIERIDFGAKEDVINLASFVYLLFGTAVISTILIPKNWKISTRNLVLFWAGIYLAIKTIPDTNHPLLGGVYTYISIAEIILLITFIILIRNVLENLQVLEETVANITMANVSNRVKNLDAAIPDVNKEFVRSRRYKRPLGIIVIELKPENIQTNIENLSKEILQIMMSRYSMSNLIRAIDKNIRRPDLILEQHQENRVILLLPEADTEDTKVVFENVQKLVEEKIGSPVAIGSAAFPDDAVTFDELVSRAEEMIAATAQLPSKVESIRETSDTQV